MTLEIKHVKDSRVSWFTAISDFLDIEITGFSVNIHEIDEKAHYLFFILTDGKINPIGEYMTFTECKRIITNILKDTEEYAMSLETCDTLESEVDLDEL